MTSVGSTGGSGVAVWSSVEWQQGAVSWLDQQLAAVGLRRTGPVEHPHIRPWATAIRAPTTEGRVWLKATGPATSHEVRLYPLLARLSPGQVLTPIAADASRGWIVLPDGGPSIGERLTDVSLAEALMAALVQYAELQIELMGHATELLAAGVPDMRPAVLPDRFEEALTSCRAEVGQPGDVAKYSAVEQLRPAIREWCAELAGSGLAPSLDHNDLHPWNILGGMGRFRFYDWGDSVLAHPFAAMLVPLGFVRGLLGVSVDDRQFVRARDAYLEVFAQLAPGENLIRTLEVACRVAKIARVLTWERALVAAREQGTELRADYRRAPLETLFSLLDESYLGGA